MAIGRHSDYDNERTPHSLPNFAPHRIMHTGQTQIAKRQQHLCTEEHSRSRDEIFDKRMLNFNGQMLTHFDSCINTTLIQL